MKLVVPDLRQNFVSTPNVFAPLLLFTFKVIDRVVVTMRALSSHVIHEVFSTVNFDGCTIFAASADVRMEKFPETSLSPDEGFFWKRLNN